MKLVSAKLVIAGALLCAALSGCVVAPAPGYGEVVAYQAPPPAQVETIGVAPAPGYFWIGGAWFWEGGRYAWHPGHWSAPRPGYHWVGMPGSAGSGWHMGPGHWARG